MLPTLCLISTSSSGSCVGATAGCTNLRCTPCFGSSIAMNMGVTNSGGASPITIFVSEEKRL